MGNLRFWIYRKRTEEELKKIFNEFEFKLVTTFAMYEYAGIKKRRLNMPYNHLKMTSMWRKCGAETKRRNLTVYKRLIRIIEQLFI